MRHAIRAIARALVAICIFSVLGNRAHAQNTGQQPYVSALSTLTGYTITQGNAIQFPGCPVFINAFGSCFGNNTATPYIVTQPPVVSPNALPVYAQSSNFTNSTGTDDDLWQVDGAGAIVTIITLSPQGAYFGFQTYLLERSAALYGQSVGTSCTGGTTDTFTNANGNKVVATQTPHAGARLKHASCHNNSYE